MAAGDLVTANEQYEWGAVLMGDSTTTPWVVSRTEGIRSQPELASSHTDRTDDHGGFPGPSFLKPRWISLELAGRRNAVDASTYTFEKLCAACYPVDDVPGAYPTLLPFVFQLPVWGKRQVMCRPERRDFEVNAGVYSGHVSLWCPDPRLYTFTETTTTITLAIGATTGSATVAPGDDFNTPPIIEIQGPATNPRIASTAWARTMAFDLILTAADTLIIDVAKKTITLAGVDRYDVRRTDNQWFNLKPTDTLTVSRSSGNTGAAAQFRFKHRGARL